MTDPSTFPGPAGPMSYRQFGCEAVRGRLMVLHGLSEYSRRYELVGAAMAEQGWEVFVHDQRGHGDSPGPRGHIDRFGDYVSDAHAFYAWVAEQHPWSGPRYLLGHSMGGLVATHYAIDHPDDFSGLILCGPLFGISARVPLYKRLASRLLSWVMPRLAMSSGFDPSLLSHDPERVADHVADPHAHRLATARWYLEALGAMDRAHARAPDLDIPCLILQGTDDRLTCAEASRRFCDALGSTDKTYHSFEGLYHELLQETRRQEVFDLIGDWLEARACASSAA